MIKVLLERCVRKENLSKLLATLEDIRAASLRQPGYVTGETLIKGTDPLDVLVISTWISESHWNAWTTSQERIMLNDMINHLIEGEAKVNVYRMASQED